MPSLDDVDPVFLAQPTCALATTFPGGGPQITPVWFVVDDGCIAISARGDRKKVANLASNNRGSVMIYHPDTDLCYVEIRGPITVTADSDYKFADRLGPVKYNTDMRSFDAAGAQRVKLSLRPEKIVNFDARG